MRVMAVVQLGLAMMPLWFLILCPLISGTTSGTWSLALKADELSTTMAPEFTAMGTNSLEMDAPALKKARSVSVKELTWRGSTVSSWPRKGIVRPADLGDARSRMEEAGNFRFSMTARSSIPTAPVAPTMAT